MALIGLDNLVQLLSTLSLASDNYQHILPIKNNPPHSRSELCRNYQRGNCRRAESCRYLHEQRRNAPNTHRAAQATENINLNRRGSAQDNKDHNQSAYKAILTPSKPTSSNNINTPAPTRRIQQQQTPSVRLLPPPPISRVRLHLAPNLSTIKSKSHLLCHQTLKSSAKTKSAVEVTKNTVETCLLIYLYIEECHGKAISRIAGFPPEIPFRLKHLLIRNFSRRPQELAQIRAEFRPTIEEYETAVEEYEERSTSAETINYEDVKLCLLFRFLRNFLGHFQLEFLPDSEAISIRNIVVGLALQILINALWSAENYDASELRKIVGAQAIKYINEYPEIIIFPAAFIAQPIEYDKPWTLGAWTVEESAQQFLEFKLISAAMKNEVRKAAENYLFSRKDEIIELSREEIKVNDPSISAAQ
jgi:hypothetical protein